MGWKGKNHGNNQTKTHHETSVSCCPARYPARTRPKSVTAVACVDGPESLSPPCYAIVIS
jgi:hypothetical protein